MASAAQPRQIDLDSMSIEQLHQIKQSEEQRLQAVVQHYSTLRASATRMQASQTALSKMSKAGNCKDDNLKQIMVPLTESLYVPGKIRDANKVMVELGTGYYVEKNLKQALELLDRKTKLVDANSENIREVITVSRRNIDSVNVAMNGKMLQIRAKQEGQRIQNQEMAE